MKGGRSEKFFTFTSMSRITELFYKPHYELNEISLDIRSRVRYLQQLGIGKFDISNLNHTYCYSRSAESKLVHVIWARFIGGPM